MADKSARRQPDIRLDSHTCTRNALRLGRKRTLELLLADSNLFNGRKGSRRNSYNVWQNVCRNVVDELSGPIDGFPARQDVGSRIEVPLRGRSLSVLTKRERPGRNSGRAAPVFRDDVRRVYCVPPLASRFCFSRCSRIRALRDSRILLPSMASTFTST